MSVEEKSMGQKEAVQPETKDTPKIELNRREFFVLGTAGIAGVLAAAVTNHLSQRSRALENALKIGSPPVGDESRVVKEVVKEESSPTKEIEVKEVVKLLNGLNNEVEDIYSRRRMWGGWNDYRVKEGDTLSSLAQKIGRTPEEIIERNWRQLDDSEMLYPDQELALPRSIYPSEVLKKLFYRLNKDRVRLGKVIKSHGLESGETKQMAREIEKYWNSAPAEGEEAQKPVLDVDPATGEKGKLIAAAIKEFFEAVPNLGRAVGEVRIVRREDFPRWPKMGIQTYEDKGATITVLNPRLDQNGNITDWTRDRILGSFSHESLGHAMSLYNPGYNLRWLTPAQVIELTHEQTVLWDRLYSPEGRGKEGVSGSEGERNASRIDRFFSGGESESSYFQNLDPKYVNQLEAHFNRVISATLGHSFTLDGLAQSLKVR